MVVANQRVGHPAAVQDHLVAFLMGVDHVVHEKRGHIEPAHVGICAMAWHHADAAGQVTKEPHPGAAPGQLGGIEHHRHVQKHRVARRDGEVVLQPGPREVNGLKVGDGAVRSHYAHVQVGREHRVAGEHHFTGGGIHLGMGIHGHAQCAAEGAHSQGLQGGRIQLMHGTRQPPQGKQASGVGDNVGIGGVFERATGYGEVGLFKDAGQTGMASIQIGFQACGTHPPVAVAGRACAEMHSVHHAVAIEPVVTPRWVKGRIGAVAHEQAFQVGWNLAGQDLKPCNGGFSVHGLVRTPQIGLSGVVSGCGLKGDGHHYPPHRCWHHWRRVTGGV